MAIDTGNVQFLMKRITLMAEVFLLSPQVIALVYNKLSPVYPKQD